MKILLALLITLLAGCATSGAREEFDSFTGKTKRSARVIVRPDLVSVINVQMSRTIEDNSKVDLVVSVNRSGFRFKSDQAFGIKADNQITWFKRKSGSEEKIQHVQAGHTHETIVSAEFEPTDLAVWKTFARAQNLSMQAVGVSSNLSVDLMEEDRLAISGLVQ